MWITLTSDHTTKSCIFNINHCCEYHLLTYLIFAVFNDYHWFVTYNFIIIKRILHACVVFILQMYNTANFKITMIHFYSVIFQS